VVIHPLQGEVPRPSLLGDLIKVLVLTQSFEDCPHHGIGLSSPDDLTGAAHDAHALEDGARKWTGDHRSLTGGGTNINPAIVLSSHEIMSEGSVLVEVQEDQVAQSSSVTDRDRE
jgi:hypothetical protein